MTSRDHHAVALVLTQEVLLIQTDRYLRPHLFSDWG